MHTKLANFPHACLRKVVSTVIEYGEGVCVLLVSRLDLEVVQTLSDAMMVGIPLMSRCTHLRNRLLLITIWAIITLQKNSCPAAKSRSCIYYEEAGGWSSQEVAFPYVSSVQVHCNSPALSIRHAMYS